MSTLSLPLRAKAVTIEVTFYGHVSGLNEPAVDPYEGIKTRGPRTNYGRGINRARPRNFPETSRHGVRDKSDVTLCKCIQRARRRVARGREARDGPVTRETFCGNEGGGKEG